MKVVKDEMDIAMLSHELKVRLNIYGIQKLAQMVDTSESQICCMEYSHTGVYLLVTQPFLQRQQSSVLDIKD